MQHLIYNLARRDFSDSYVLFNLSTLVTAYPYVSEVKYEIR